MKIAVVIARFLLGGVFVVFGLNGFLGFLEPPPLEGDAGTFVGILHGSGYLAVVKILEIAGGLALLTGKLTPFGLILLGPVIVNILLFHAFLAPSGLPMALVLTLLACFLIWRHWSTFSPIVKVQ